MKDNRPVNLDITSIRFPLTALASIVHRISGIIVFVGIAFLLWMFDASLSSEESFRELKSLGQSNLVKLILWGTLSALVYHMVAGIKHLLMDMGVAETKESAPVAASIVVIVSVVLIISLGVCIW